MNWTQVIVAFVGGGFITAIFNFILNIKKQKNADSQSLINDIYKEIGRLSQELKQVKEEKEKAEVENLNLKEKNMKMQIQLDELQKDYQELKSLNEELRRNIDILLKNNSKE